MLEYHCNIYEVVVAGGGQRNKSEAQSMQEYAMLISNRTVPSDRQDLSVSNCAWGPALCGFCFTSCAGILNAFFMQPAALM